MERRKWVDKENADGKKRKKVYLREDEIACSGETVEK